jgi:hypothetical protein
MKKCSTSLAIREMQIRILLRFHLTSVRMAVIKETKNNQDAGNHYRGSSKN